MTDTLTTEQLAELEALLEKATPGPWRVEETGWSDDAQDIADAATIATLRNAAPALLAMARQASEADTVLRQFFDTFMPMKVETVQQCCDALSAKAEIDKLKDALEHWRHEVGKLQSQKDRAEKAEAERDRYRERAVRLAVSIDHHSDETNEPTSADHDLWGEMEDPDIAALLKTETNHG